jgi:hypothetical protein
VVRLLIQFALFMVQVSVTAIVAVGVMVFPWQDVGEVGATEIFDTLMLVGGAGVGGFSLHRWLSRLLR